MFKSIFLPIIGVAAFITIVGLFSQGKLNFLFSGNSPIISTKSDVLKEKTIKISDIELKVEVAKTDSERAKGLSNRSSLDQNSGMVFVFSKNSSPIFWMKDTKIPLDLIWIDDNKIVGITKNVQTEPNVSDNYLKRYQAPTHVDYVVEVNAGYSDKNNIKVGQSLSGLEQL